MQLKRKIIDFPRTAGRRLHLWHIKKKKKKRKEEEKKKEKEKEDLRKYNL
jgi:hypothetical protein